MDISILGVVETLIALVVLWALYEMGLASRPGFRKSNIGSDGILLKSRGYMGPLSSLPQVTQRGVRFNQNELHLNWEDVQSLQFGSWWRWWMIFRLRILSTPERYLIIQSKDLSYFVIPLYWGPFSWSSIKTTLKQIGKEELLDGEIYKF